MANVSTDTSGLERKFQRLFRFMPRTGPYGGNPRPLLLKLGDDQVRSIRANVLREETPEGRSFRGTLAPSTQKAIKQRQLAYGRGAKRRGKKMRTVRGGAHERRGGLHVLRANDHMFEAIDVASVGARHVEVGMINAFEAKKATGHHFPNPRGSKRPPHYPFRGPVRRFIGFARRDYDRIALTVQRFTAGQPGLEAA